MIQDLGTVRPGTTLYIPFHTFDSNDPSASVTLTGLATTDIEIYKDGSTTQRASDAGYALLDTDGIDFDTITGIHGISVSLADNTTAGFYAAGSQYWIVISSITVDAATINFILATFRIGYEDAVINTTIATLASQTSFTLTSGPAEDDALNGCVVCIHDVASAVQLGYGVVSDYTGSTKTVTLAAGTTFTAAAADNISIFPPSNAHTISPGAITAAVIATDAIDADAIADNAINAAAIAADAITDAKVASDVTIASVTGAVGSVTGNVGGNVTGSIGSVATGGITAGSIAADAIGASELAADAIAEIADAVWDEDATGHQTQGTFGQAIGDPVADTNTIFKATVTDATGATVGVDGASIKAKTDSLTFGTANRVDAQVVGMDADTITNAAIADDAITAGAIAAESITAAKFGADAIDANALAADAVTEIQNGLATAANQTTILAKLNGLCPVSGTIGATGNTTTALHLAGLTYGNDEINSLTLVIYDVSASEYHVRWIEDWADTGDLATVATLPFTPQASTDLYWILPTRADVTGGSGLDAAGVRAALGMASANLDTQIDALPTNAELATALAGADDAILTVLGTPAGASISADILTIDNLVDDLESRVGTPSNLGSGATVAANLVDIEAQTDDIGTAGAGLTAVPWNAAWDAEVQSECTDALNAYDPPTRAEATSDKDEILADTNDIQSRIPAALTAGGNIKADALAIDGSTTAADRLQRSAEAIAFATVGSGSTTTSIVTSAIDPSATAADQFKGRIVIFDKATTTAALRGQATDITASTSGGVLTVTALTTAPASGDTFTIT